jgi:hypothetical protein
MGFESTAAEAVLDASGGDIQRALDILTYPGAPSEEDTSAERMRSPQLADGKRYALTLR